MLACDVGPSPQPPEQQLEAWKLLSAGALKLSTMGPWGTKLEKPSAIRISWGAVYGSYNGQRRTSSDGGTALGLVYTP